MTQQSDLLVRLATARLSVTEFEQFLRKRERLFLDTHEPAFIEAVRELPSRHPTPDESLMREVIIPKLKTKPTEWVRLMQETSDVLTALRHLEIIARMAHASETDVRTVAQISSIGEWIELLLYSEAEINYRVLNRLQSGLNRTVKKAKGLGDPQILERAQQLRAMVSEKFKTFKEVRGQMAHTVDFAQPGLVEVYRTWELVSIFEHPVQPREVLEKTFSREAELYRGVIDTEAAQVAQVLIDCYPEWRILLNAEFLP